MAKFEKEGYEYKGFKLGETVVYGGEEVKIVGFDTEIESSPSDVYDVMLFEKDSDTYDKTLQYFMQSLCGNDLVILDSVSLNTHIRWVNSDFLYNIPKKETENYYPNKDAECKIEYKEVFGRYVVKYNDGTVNNIELMSDREFETFKTQIDEMNKPKKWRADEGGIYYYISTIGDIKVGVDKRKEMSQFSQSHYDIGNYFKTEELAQEKLEEFKNIFK